MGTSESLFSAKALLLGREMFSFFCKEECNRIPFWLKSCSEREFQRDRKSNISYLGVFKPNADDRYYFPLDSPICSFPISQLQEMSHDQSKSGMETPFPSARTRIPATLWLGRVITNPGQKDEMYMCWRGSPLLFILGGGNYMRDDVWSSGSHPVIMNQRRPSQKANIFKKVDQCQTGRIGFLAIGMSH